MFGRYRDIQYKREKGEMVMVTRRRLLCSADYDRWLVLIYCKKSTTGWLWIMTGADLVYEKNTVGCLRDRDRAKSHHGPEWNVCSSRSARLTHPTHPTN